MAQSIQALPVGVAMLREVLISHRPKGNGFGSPIVPCKGCLVLMHSVGGAVDFKVHYYLG